MYLYEVRMNVLNATGKQKAEFFKNAIELGHTEASRSSLQQGLTLISSNGTANNVLALCSMGIKKKGLFSVVEVTLVTSAPGAMHSSYGPQIAFVKAKGNYPNL